MQKFLRLLTLSALALAIIFTFILLRSNRLYMGWYFNVLLSVIWILIAFRQIRKRRNRRFVPERREAIKKNTRIDILIALFALFELLFSSLLSWLKFDNTTLAHMLTPLFPALPATFVHGMATIIVLIILIVSMLACLIGMWTSLILSRLPEQSQPQTQR